MATLALDPLTQYLLTSYEPAAEFVDGRIEERPMGELDHSSLQTGLLLLLNQAEWRRYFRCYVELRVQTKQTNFRILDVCLLRNRAPREQVVVTPPLLCIEVLSPEDTVARTMKRVDEFLAMGVPEVWVFDPGARTVQVCAGNTKIEQTTGELQVPETPVRLSIPEIFSILDEA